MSVPTLHLDSVWSVDADGVEEGLLALRLRSLLYQLSSTLQSLMSQLKRCFPTWAIRIQDECRRPRQQNQSIYTVVCNEVIVSINTHTHTHRHTHTQRHTHAHTASRRVSHAQQNYVFCLTSDIISCQSCKDTTSRSFTASKI